VALRPRLSSGVPLSRNGEHELRVGTGDVNKASSARGTMCGTVLTADQLERLASGLRTIGSGGGVAPARVPAVAGFRTPDFQHNPSGPP
jgi:hypothetical protein